MTIEIYYAVSKQGQGRIFTSMPVRLEDFGLWDGESNGRVSMFVLEMIDRGFELPCISWNDEPVLFKVSMSNG